MVNTNEGKWRTNCKSCLDLYQLYLTTKSQIKEPNPIWVMELGATSRMFAKDNRFSSIRNVDSFIK